MILFCSAFILTKFQYGFLSSTISCLGCSQSEIIPKDASIWQCSALTQHSSSHCFFVCGQIYPCVSCLSSFFGMFIVYGY